MGKELELLKPLLEQPSEREVHGTTFHCGNIGGHQVVAMQCGIGKVNAAVGTVTLVDNFPVDAIINTGVAGGAGGGGQHRRYRRALQLRFPVRALFPAALQAPRGGVRQLRVP